jgi:hypothetical protein
MYKNATHNLGYGVTVLAFLKNELLMLSIHK